MSEGLTGFGLAKVKSEGTQMWVDTQVQIGDLLPFEPMTIQEMQQSAERDADQGFYFEIGPDNARALAGYLKELLELKR
jgi:hypothetical protein